MIYTKQLLVKTYLIYKVLRKSFLLVKNKIDYFICRIVFWGNNISYSSFKTNGVPYVSIAVGGICKVGMNLSMNNGAAGNPIGCFERCTFFVDKGAELNIGDNLGISQAAIVCHLKISIGNNVKIGGGVCIYDTDFHSLDPEKRKDASKDKRSEIKSPVVIKDNAFIGARSTILKGVTVGENSIVGACSVVCKDIPDNEIWAGNPARFIRNIGLNIN